MATFPILSGTIVTTPQTISNGQTDVIEAGGALEVTGKVALTWTGGTSEIDNSGIISATGARGIDTAKNVLAPGSSLTFNNNGGAELVASSDDAFRINADISGGAVTINNSGIIVSGTYSAGTISGTASGQALDLDNVHSSTVTINNYAGGLIGAADADAIRPGANTPGVRLFSR